MTRGPGNETAGRRGVQAGKLMPHLTRVMGVDPGSETTGYGVIDSDGRHYELVEYAGIRAPARFTFAERLFIISQKLEEVIERLRPQRKS